MSLADELERLAALHERGMLSTEEFQQAKARLIREDSAQVVPRDEGVIPPVSRLRRSSLDRWLGGVCGGLAIWTGMESWIWRLIFVAMFLLWGTGLLLYILLWVFVPDE